MGMAIAAAEESQYLFIATYFFHVTVCSERANVSMEVGV